MKIYAHLIFSAGLLSVVACSNPQPGPDKTLAGALLGAGWGATAGAAVGNQTGNEAGGVALGAGIGAVGGALTGAGYDINESAQLDEERELASLKLQNQINGRQLDSLQAKLDRAIASDGTAGVYQVYFDQDVTSLKSGAIADLEIIAQNLAASPAATYVNVVGHSDDAGTPDYNEKLAESRARAVVSYLASRGISMDRIKTRSFGSTRPLASNSTPEGRQLNRRVDVYISR